MGIVVDLFCGGASEGIRRALGRSSDIVVDFDQESIFERRRPLAEKMSAMLSSVGSMNLYRYFVGLAVMRTSYRGTHESYYRLSLVELQSWKGRCSVFTSWLA